MINRLKKWFYEERDGDYLLYKQTVERSLSAINDCKMKSNAIEYISKSKIENFIDDLGVERHIIKKVRNSSKNSVEGSLGVDLCIAKSEISGLIQQSNKEEIEIDIRSTCNDIRRYMNSDKNQLKTFNTVKKGEYFAIHFPVSGGRLNLAMNKKYPNTYYWHGKYRNLELFICGNIKNVRRQSCSNYDNYRWDPSNDGASQEVFDAIESWSLGNNDVDVEDKIEFDVLVRNINRGTARGDKSNFGWKEMIVQCDKKENFGGLMRIFGSPVIVSANSDVGYGWYNVLKKGIYDDEKYYEYYKGEFTGKVLCKNNYKNSLSGEIDKLIEMDGHDIYRQLKIENNYIFSLGRLISLYDIKKEQKNMFDEKTMLEKIDNCTDIVGICLTRRFLKNEIRKLKKK